MSASLDPGIEKMVRIKRGGSEWSVYERYTDRPRKVTPIPPLLLDKEAGFRLLHASAFAIRSCDGSEQAVVLRGKSGAGKSTLMLHSMSDGCCFVSDDMTWIRDDFVFPFTRPIGIRQGLAASLDSALVDRCQKFGYMIITGGEQTYMIHARDLGLSICEKPLSTFAFVDLVCNDTTICDVDTNSKVPELTLSWNPRKDAQAGWEALKEQLNYLGAAS